MPVSSPASTSRHRRRRDRRTTALVGGTLLAVVAGAVVAPYVVAQERAQKVLQSVTVDLGTDGTVFAITSRDVRKTRSGDDTTERRLEPGRFARELPVRITTGYVHDGRVGTDLSDLEGVDGTVEVNVTVQNLTVRPQRMDYSSGGQDREAFALVGTPMTVVASATLPEASLGRLRQPVPGTTEPHTTNGVVSRLGDTTTVQWASLLAPPRLAPSTTFTFVEEAEDFRLPDLTLSVQPGLATDTSITRLVGDAFGGSAAFVGAENNTVGLIANINDTLLQATTSLNTVRESLTANAGQVGSAATVGIAATAGDIDAASAAVVQDLQLLNGSVASTLTTTKSASLSAIDASLQDLIAYFGTATPTNGVAVGVSGCSAANAPGTALSRTLLGQLSEVSRSLKALSGASSVCVQRLRDQLTTFIGSVATCPAVPATTGSLVCQLQGTSQRLTGVALQLTEEGSKILGAFDAEAVQRVDDRLDEVLTSVKDVQTQAGALQGPGSSLEELQTTLQELEAKVATATGSNAAGATGLVAALAELNQLAVTRAAVVSGSIAGGLVALGNAICVPIVVPAIESDTDTVAVRAYAEQVQAYANALRQRVDGQDCAAGPVEVPRVPRPLPSPVVTLPAATPSVGTGLDDGDDEDIVDGALGDLGALPMPDLVAGSDQTTDDDEVDATPSATPTATTAPPTTGGLLALIADDAAAWQRVADLTSLTGAGGSNKGKNATEAAGSVASELTSLGEQVTAALELVRGPKSSAGQRNAKAVRKSVRDSVIDIVTRSKALYVPAAPGGPDTCTPTPPSAGALNALERDFRTLACNQAGVDASLEKLLDTNAPGYADAAKAVGAQAAVLDETRTVQDSQLGDLLARLTGQLTTTADRQLEQGRSVVAQQRAALEGQKQAAAKKLDSAAQSAIALLAQQIARSNQQQTAAADRLQAQLRTVLLDLGSASDGRGLLGSIQDSAGQTGVRAAQVQEASRAASRFRGVRLAEIGDAQLEQRTARRSLQLAQAYPPFDLELPAGSQHSTVFTLDLRPVG